MTYKFTNRAKKAIEIANDVAIELGHNIQLLSFKICLITSALFISLS